MEKCLVTKLKNVINNDSLQKVGELHIQVKRSDVAPNQYTAGINLRNGNAFEVRATNGAYFTEAYNTGEHLTSISIPANTTKEIFIGNANGDIFIGEKYTLVYLGNEYAKNTTFLYMDVDELKYSDNINIIGIGKGLKGNLSVLFDKTMLTRLAENSMDSESIAFTSTGFVVLDISKSSAKGNLLELPTMNNLTILRINNSTNIKGTSADLAKFPITSIISLNGSGVTGAIEDLVEAYITKGISTYEGKNLYDLPVYQNLTFGGRHYATGVQYTYLSWESANKIWLAGGATVYDNCPNIWCKGYTQEEANAKWPGKTIVRVDA